jgi:hypothetical protein
MKTKIKLIVILVAVVLIGVLAFAVLNQPASNQTPNGQNWRTAAGTNRSPPSGLTKNSTLFAQYFAKMDLVTDSSTGFDSATQSFTSAQDVIVLANTTSPVTLLVYVDNTGNRGAYTGVEKEQPLPLGLTALNLGKFQPSTYVVRVLVNDVCIENLQFTVT